MKLIPFFKLSLILILALMSACAYQHKEADLIVHNARIYTVDDNFSVVEAMAIKDGLIIETGPERAILNKYHSENKIDARQQAVYPGFIDAHCHFLGYGLSLFRVDLTGTRSWEEVLQRVDQFVIKNNPTVIEGRGWDQNDWPVEDFPSNKELNLKFPNTPVLLKRIDGHAAIANAVALDLADVHAGDKIDGGVIKSINGNLSGLLIDNAIDLVARKLPRPTQKEVEAALLAAQKNCFEVGLTTVDDAGLDRDAILLIDKMQKDTRLKMRIYAMVSDNAENLEYFFSRGKIKTHYLNVQSIKVYADGALGSRGACLLHPYSDNSENTGFLLHPISHFDSIAEACYKYGFQMNTHCIGDSANRILAAVYAKTLKGINDRRWRIEHAQIVEKSDLELFSDFSIIPSVQPTHATSDMYWAEQRLGKIRMDEAYAYSDLLKTNGLIALGTDFPVENINPILTFYAAVARKDTKGYPENGFLPKQGLSREQALKGMTIWAAISNFEESEKGSLQAGKMADFVILDRDIMNVSENKIFDAKIQATYIGGEQVYKR